MLPVSYLFVVFFVLMAWRHFVSPHYQRESTSRYVDLLTPIAVDLAVKLRLIGESNTDKANCWIIQLNDVMYYIQTKEGVEETAEWLDEYSKYGPVCEGCNTLILPGYEVHKIKGKYYHGIPYKCSGIPTYHWGTVDESGNLVPTFLSGRNMAEEVFKTGKILIRTESVPTLDNNKYIVRHYLPVINQ